MKHIVIGTAGHVDHGKTCLTKALTGVDTDRLKEEQKRGITIEIGFAQLTLPNGQRASIVDVPGHERLIHNMLMGATGIDVVLLVIAADEGFMPQTREHLDILSLLDVKNGIIVLTKCDLADPEWMEAVEEDIRDQVQGSFLENAPIVHVSSYTGEGIEELKAKIVELLAGKANLFRFAGSAGSLQKGVHLLVGIHLSPELLFERGPFYLELCELAADFISVLPFLSDFFVAEAGCREAFEDLQGAFLLLFKRRPCSDTGIYIESGEVQLEEFVEHRAHCERAYCHLETMALKFAFVAMGGHVEDVTEKVVAAGGRTTRACRLHGKAAESQTFKHVSDGIGVACRNGLWICEEVVQIVLQHMPGLRVNGLRAHEVRNHPLRTCGHLGCEVGVAGSCHFGWGCGDYVDVGHNRHRGWAGEGLLGALICDGRAERRVTVNGGRGGKGEVRLAVVVRGELAEVVDDPGAHAHQHRLRISVQ